MPMTSRSRGVRAAAVLVIATSPGHAATAFAQTAIPPRREGPVVRVTTGLVQIDAVVTDGHGKHVTDLGPGDFVVREGGQLRQVTQVSYIALGPPSPSEAAPPTNAAAPPPA